MFPHFLNDIVEEATYNRWLKRQANRHLKRDNVRWGRGYSRKIYQQKIGEAVIRSKGRDAYTGRELDWHLISKYRAGHKRSAYKNLPTVDHAFCAGSEPFFAICSWAVNDCKNDLTVAEWIDLMTAVIAHQKTSAEPALDLLTNH